MTMLSIGILTYKAPQTLTDTLRTYATGGLFNCANDVLVWIQPSATAQEETFICQSFGINSKIGEANTWIGGGFRNLAHNLKCDKILLLENDFRLIEPPTETRKILSTAEALIDDEIAHCVRLRSIRDPGQPNWGMTIKHKVLVDEFNSLSHLSECAYWDPNPHITYPQDIIKIHDDPSWFLTSSRRSCFTNNPVIYTKQFYLDHITQFLEDGQDIETKATQWWYHQDFRCAFGSGLFKHERHDGK